MLIVTENGLIAKTATHIFTKKFTELEATILGHQPALIHASGCMNLRIPPVSLSVTRVVTQIWIVRSI